MARQIIADHPGRYRQSPSQQSQGVSILCGVNRISPRRTTFWLEPDITVAGLRRMQRKFGWPAERLGAQSLTYAFDFVGYQGDQRTQLVSCEVKPTRKPVDLLVALMTMQGNRLTGVKQSYLVGARP